MILRPKPIEHIQSLFDGGIKENMSAIAMVIIGFTIGLFSMTIISFYKWVLEKMNE